MNNNVKVNAENSAKYILNRLCECEGELPPGTDMQGVLKHVPQDLVHGFNLMLYAAELFCENTKLNKILSN